VEEGGAAAGNGGGAEKVDGVPAEAEDDESLSDGGKWSGLGGEPDSDGGDALGGAGPGLQIGESDVFAAGAPHEVVEAEAGRLGRAAGKFGKAAGADARDEGELVETGKILG
jgi:hypothetical protein